MENSLGRKIWIIADGYLPGKSNGDFISHESVCVLNLNEETAKIKITIYFEDKDPMEGFEALCDAKRTNHIRLEKIKDKSGNNIPRGIPYAIKVESNIPVVVQHTRLDTSQPELSLMTTMGYPLN